MIKNQCVATRCLKRDALNFISSKIGMPFKVFLISSADFDRVIDLYKGLSGEVTKALTELETAFVSDSKNIEIEESEEKKGRSVSL